VRPAELFQLFEQRSSFPPFRIFEQTVKRRHNYRP
jgi:hypothetical protein